MDQRVRPAHRLPRNLSLAIPVLTALDWWRAPLGVRLQSSDPAEDLVTVLDGVELQRSEMRAFRESMRADFAEFRGELERQLAALRQEMTASHGALGERIAGVESRLMKWSLLFRTAAVLAIAGLVVPMR